MILQCELLALSWRIVLSNQYQSKFNSPKREEISCSNTKTSTGNLHQLHAQHQYYGANNVNYRHSCENELKSKLPEPNSKSIINGTICSSNYQRKASLNQYHCSHIKQKVLSCSNILNKESFKSNSVSFSSWI